MKILETERIILQQLSTHDAPFILELVNTPSWLKFIGDRGIRTITDAENYILNGPMKSYEKFDFGLYLVKLKNENTPIGMCGLIKRDTLKDVDIGFAFLPGYEGKGYAFESAEATLKYGKTNLGLNRIVAITVSYNQRSIELLKKLGFEFEEMIHFPYDKEELMLFGSRIS